MLILQCNVLVDTDFVLLTKFNIDRIRSEYLEGNPDAAPKHVILVLHLNREQHAAKRPIEEWQFDFLCGWELTAFDTVIPNFTSLFDIRELSVTRILQEIPALSFRSIVEHVLTWCFTCIRYPTLQSVVSHIRHLREKILSESRVLGLLERHVATVLQTPEDDWQVKIACNRRA